MASTANLSCYHHSAGAPNDYEGIFKVTGPVLVNHRMLSATRRLALLRNFAWQAPEFV